MTVNIVILVKNRPRLTAQTFKTLFKNTQQQLYNITIVDDESELDGDCPVGDAVCGSNVTCLRISSSKGITGQARNLGIYWAEKYWGRGNYLYLSDNDVYFMPGWLEVLTKVLESAEREDMGWRYKVLGGWNHPFLHPNTEITEGRQWARGMNFSSTHPEYDGVMHSHDAVAGASQLMRWETWDKYGPLDAHAVGVGQSEDWAFCQKIINDGGKVGSIYPRVVLNCGITNSFGEPSPGADFMLKELLEAKRTYPDLYYE